MGVNSLSTLGCENQFNGAEPERHGGGAANAKVQRAAELRGASGGDEADGGLPQPHQVHEEQGLRQHEMEFSWTDLLQSLIGLYIKSYVLVSYPSFPLFSSLGISFFRWSR